MTATFAPTRSGVTAPTPPPAGQRFGRKLRSLGTASRAAAAQSPNEYRIVAWILMAISALTAWLLAFVFVLSSLQQQRTNTVLYSQLRYGLSEATAPIGGVIAPGSPIALIEAPVEGLRGAVLVEGTAPSDLMTGPGHRRDTPLPGQPGVSLVYGRSLTYGAPLGKVDQLRPGQQIKVTTGQGVFAYVVDRVRHTGDPLPAVLKTGGSRLTFETSTGSGLAPQTTVFVDSTLKGDTVPAPSGRLRSVPKSEMAMQGDTSHLVNLVLWLQLLVVVSLGVVWAAVRWGRWQAWLVGIPMLVAVAWASTNNVMLLLPNLI